MKIGLTGGAGFIGSHLVDRLVGVTRFVAIGEPMRQLLQPEPPNGPLFGQPLMLERSKPLFGPPPMPGESEQISVE